MADITPAVPPEINVIHAYGDGGFRIAGVAHSGSVVVLPTGIAPWPVGAVADITEGSLEVVTESEPRVELLLLGCGERMAQVPAELRRRCARPASSSSRWIPAPPAAPTMCWWPKAGASRRRSSRFPETRRLSKKRGHAGPVSASRTASAQVSRRSTARPCNTASGSTASCWCARTAWPCAPAFVLASASAVDDAQRHLLVRPDDEPDVERT